MKPGKIIMIMLAASLSAVMLVFIFKKLEDANVATVKYEITFNNGDKDTITYNGPYIREYLDKGDFKIISGGIDHPTIASGVRTYRIIKY